MAIRRSRLLERATQRRDAALCIIATEDTYAPEQYFRALTDQQVIDGSRVKIRVEPTLDGKSSLASLVARLDQVRTGLEDRTSEDEFWLVFDVDHHRDKELSEQVAVALQKDLKLAGSNPCFELWLLLHETDDLTRVRTYADHTRAARDCEGLLREALGGSYNKTRLDPARYSLARVQLAVDRGQQREESPQSRWPGEVGTHLHRLVGGLLSRFPAK